MRVHMSQGNRAEAVLAYEECRAILARDLGVTPSSQTEPSTARCSLPAEHRAPSGCPLGTRSRIEGDPDRHTRAQAPTTQADPDRRVWLLRPCTGIRAQPPVGSKTVDHEARVGQRRRRLGRPRSAVPPARDREHRGRRDPASGRDRTAPRSPYADASTACGRHVGGGAGRHGRVQNMRGPRCAGAPRAETLEVPGNDPLQRRLVDNGPPPRRRADVTQAGSVWLVGRTGTVEALWRGRSGAGRISFGHIEHLRHLGSARRGVVRHRRRARRQA
jgi:hypothetical protein